ncbi:hypothetical protein [Parapedobacter tibetensis]|uniref:hypothetical protein n=1 Tax=Parapedobacter tibetensis TaxID=2972951 RepID=UPI00214DD740|nr:hypothetical protein [Parapedobacter tibetensis]
MREITIEDIGNQRVGDLLDDISKNQGFYFAYNSNAIAADSVITLSDFRGRLVDFLESTLGRDYEFKESPGYVIIRYAPGSMELTFHVEKDRGNPLVVEGKIKDASNDKGVHLASIYERNILVSTLSDPGGNFKLTIKRPGETIWLTISKENYRDTTVMLLPPVQVKPKNKWSRYRYYPDDSEGSGLEGTAFGRFFISSKQRIQSVNLGGFFAYSPYQVSVTPGLSSHGMFNSQVVNQVSLNLIGGYTAGVNGVEIAGGFNINQKDARDLQIAGLFNVVGRHAQGLQLAGASNIVMHSVSGMQLAGLGNWGSDVKGVQLSGMFNVAENIRGIQVTGVINKSVGETGNQIAGGVNIAGKVKGIQLAGLVNMADSSDYPIGLINLIKQGSKGLSVAMDESSMAQVAFRSGGRVLYGLIGAGYYLNGNPMKYAIETGIGVHILRRGPFNLDAEMVNRASTDFKKHSEPRLSFRLLSQVYLGRHLGIIAGPTVNYTYPDKGATVSSVIPGWKWYHNTETGKALYMGIYSGLLYRW